MAEIPNYVVDSGDFTPQEIVDVIPEQTKQDQQVRSQEEKYLQQLEQNAEDRIRNTEKTWEGLSKLSGKVGDIIQKKRDKFRSDRIATLQLKVLTNGVGDNLSEHFETGRELLFQDHVDINTAASNYEAKTGDAITADEFRNMSGWEQYAVAEEFAKKKGLTYPDFHREAKQNMSIDVVKNGQTVQVKFPQSTTDYQPTEAEYASLNQTIKFEFARQLGGLNEAMVAKYIKKPIDDFEAEQTRQARADRKIADKNLRDASDLRSTENAINLGNEEGITDYNNFVKLYRGRNTGATMEEANAQYALNLVALVKDKKITQLQALTLIDEEFEGDSGIRTIAGAKGNDDLREAIVRAGVEVDKTEKDILDNQVATDVGLLEQMGPISSIQEATLRKAFKEKYDGNIPLEISNKLQGYEDDKEATDRLTEARRYQGGVYAFQLKNVSTAVYDKFKGDILGDDSPLTPGTQAYKDNQNLFNTYTQTTLESEFGVSDIKSIEFLQLRGSIEAVYNSAYKIAYAANKDHNLAHSQGMQAVQALRGDQARINAIIKEDDYEPTEQEKTFAYNVVGGSESGRGGAWKTNRMSLAGRKNEQELIAWSKSPLKRVADMPQYYVRVAKLLGIAPTDLATAQLALFNEEPLDEKQLSQELTEDKSILRAIFKNPNTYSVIQGAMMLEDEETEGETTKDTTIFNNSEVLNDDI